MAFLFVKIAPEAVYGVRGIGDDAPCLESLDRALDLSRLGVLDVDAEEQGPRG